MEVGEPVSVPVPPPQSETKYLRGEIIKIVFESTIKVSVAQTTVKAPHWETGAAVEESTWQLGKQTINGLYSKRPAVYLRKSAGGPRTATVTVKITASNVSGNGKLIGTLSSLRFEGDCPLGAGEHSVVVELQEVPDDFNSFGGNIAWGIEGAELSVALNGTRAELFFVYGDPHQGYKPGVWIEALRFLASRVALRGTSKPADAVAKIARYCHGGHGLKYDTMRGAPHYGPGNLGGTFQLKNYMVLASPVANCYDQAGATEVWCGTAGIDTRWIYLDPYGYIRPTTLLGVGMCNNPFFSSNGTRRLVPTDDPDRTAFGNHAFNSYSSKILDACAGPHIGTETEQEYVDAAIDNKKSLYPSGFSPGTPGDMMRLGQAIRNIV